MFVTYQREKTKRYMRTSHNDKIIKISVLQISPSFSGEVDVERISRSSAAEGQARSPGQSRTAYPRRKSPQAAGPGREPSVKIK